MHEPGVLVSFLLLHCSSAWEALAPATTSAPSNRRSFALTQSRHLRRAARSSLASLVSRRMIPSHRDHWRPSRGTHRQGWVKATVCLCVGHVSVLCGRMYTCVYLLTVYLPVCLYHMHTVPIPCLHLQCVVTCYTLM